VVSHNIPVIKSVSSHVAWLREGRLSEIGAVESDVLQRYTA